MQHDRNDRDDADDSTQVTSDENEKKAFVASVFRDVWQDFYVWEQAHCAAAIQKILQTHEPEPTVEEKVVPAASSSTSQTPVTALQYTENWPNAKRDLVQSDVHLVFTASERGSDDKVADVLQWNISVCPSVRAPEVAPGPRYEFCKHSQRRVHVGDDPDELRFFPHVDDKEFDREGYEKEHKSLGWQSATPSPDRAYSLLLRLPIECDGNIPVEIILLETTTRLNSYHDIPPEDVDNLGTLPARLAPLDDSVELLSKLRERYADPRFSGHSNTLFAGTFCNGRCSRTNTQRFRVSPKHRRRPTRWPA